ncbi:MAG TPA: adenylosuccinate synthetase [Candidatus Acetothermia bacterium]|nr:adenylosuccinate synthetase [Candidatus Acetothermia bacterium]
MTSSTTTVHGVGWGVGVRLSEGARVIGVSKAYTTRVGEGPFPTEDTGEGGDLLRQKGREYGATTGRPRRCGWLDLVALRYAQEVNSFTELAITKLDVLSGLDEIPVCTAYDLEGEKVEVLPRTLAELSAARPHYERLPGWKEDIRKARTPSDLPREARSYIAFVEEVLGVPVTMAGVGPGEDELVVLR